MHPSSLVNTAVTGASGFVGSALIAALIESSYYRVHALRHSSTLSTSLTPLTKNTWGNLLKADTIKDWPPPGATIVHLAFMWDFSAEYNYLATNNLLDSCRRAGIKRFIHVSTAAVVGRASASLINEDTPCCPFTEYGQTKLKIEELILESAVKNNFDLVILRPTSVYGRGGDPLVKLCRELCHSAWPMNYLKACIFGYRSMNLVHLDNVIAAIQFLIEYPFDFHSKKFIISDDHDVLNNFSDIEKMARKVLGVNDYPVPVMQPSSSFLSLILRMRGRNIVDPYSRFSSQRLFSLGFQPPISFEDGLKDYFQWYRRTTLKW